jgi:hypothetical protein
MKYTINKLSQPKYKKQYREDVTLGHALFAPILTHKNVMLVYIFTPLFYGVYHYESGNYPQLFVRTSNIRFHQNQSSGS